MHARFSILMLSLGLAAAVPGAHAQGAASTQPDRALATSVRAALAGASDVNVSRIAVLGGQQRVILEGTVPDYAQIDRAKRYAQSVAGGAEVVSRLTVRVSGRGS
ncbi:BON domain-containing protein [Burkholderia guangdongensis]|uniref:BON domain-containing protein n=1 Tax=Burkholderia guangdongensis TaxID=1792500 RepID=UPI0015CB712D|nr:BON domain-containing protein [Burkholderia guangdongensis]